MKDAFSLQVQLPPSVQKHLTCALLLSCWKQWKFLWRTDHTLEPTAPLRLVAFRVMVSFSSNISSPQHTYMHSIDNRILWLRDVHKKQRRSCLLLVQRRPARPSVRSSWSPISSVPQACPATKWCGLKRLTIQSSTQDVCFEVANCLGCLGCLGCLCSNFL